MKIKESYYKRSRPGHSPMKFILKGKTAHVKKDPVLKKHPKIEKHMLKHERTEIKLRAKGVHPVKAHNVARSKEHPSIRKMGLSQMWRKLK